MIYKQEKEPQSMIDDYEFKKYPLDHQQGRSEDEKFLDWLKCNHQILYEQFQTEYKKQCQQNQ